MTEQKIRVGKRLLAAAEYVAVSSVKNSDGKKICADIGCDHGYLSIYLIEKGICDFVYASDINEKPVSIAKKNISARDTRGLGLSEKIDIRLGDGLAGLENNGINYVIICGMGGEVISGILERSRDFWKNGVNFILQPMSSELELRAWLSENGFCIDDEKLVRDSGRIYTVMSVSYTGEKYEYSQSELMLGQKNIQKGGELLFELCGRKLGHARNLLRQQEVSEEDKALERELSELLESLK
ncbi:MAG: SAM-dependent methyltransferase [Ruminococcaceae bacterium]|nr:SAM-dependent methyltransferase [Oscillospiraceae bacterium]